MDMPSLTYTLVSFVGVIILMVIVLYGIRWIMGKTNFSLSNSKNSEFKVTDRLILDPKHQIIGFQDKNHHYVILLSESNLILDKSPLKEIN